MRHSSSQARAIVEQTCECMRAGQQHRPYMTCVKRMLKAAQLPALVIPRWCRNLVKQCESRSICGNPDAVVCCKTKKNGKVVASMRKSTARCRSGTACGASLGLLGGDRRSLRRQPHCRGDRCHDESGRRKVPGQGAEGGPAAERNAIQAVPQVQEARDGRPDRSDPVGRRSGDLLPDRPRRRCDLAESGGEATGRIDGQLCRGDPHGGVPDRAPVPCPGS